MTDNRRKTFQITINGRDYTVAGIDDPMKIRRITEVINDKVRQLGGLRKYNQDTKAAMIQINLAEDLVDLMQTRDEMTIKAERHEQEIYELKQEVIGVRMDNHKQAAQIEILKQEKEELLIRIAALEAAAGRRPK